MSRKCKNLKCTAEVPHPKHCSGYCNGRKVKHWNEGEPLPWWIKCECGAESCKTKANPTPVHGDYCPVFKFKEST